MKFCSTNDRELSVGWEKAVMEGMAPDGGLYLPESIPAVAKSEFSRLGTLSYADLSLDLLWRFAPEDWDRAEFERIVQGAFDFPVELKDAGGIWLLELFHGPSQSFKDFGARFLAGILEGLLSRMGREATLITATSGDTGGAVAKAFASSKRIKTLILYPAGRISRIQEKQITTAGDNVSAIAIEGDFDSCQALVKRAMADESLKGLVITSANSINIGRLIPQLVYYAYASLKTSPPNGVSIVSAPCGNYGNLTAGLIAQRMGFPLKFVAACNANAVAFDYLSTGVFAPRPTRHTLSSAMDIGDPSNFARVLSLFGNDREEFGNLVSATVSTDEDTLAAMGDVFQRHGHILDPHSAVAWHGMAKYLCLHGHEKEAPVVLETAHPAKFPETVSRATGREADIPAELSADLAKEGRFTPMPNDYAALKDFILKNPMG